ncbi:MAG: hypothetical protein KJO19_07925 [Woeseia sp.]|nr:hypothetical protein [Woeseia sp.]MBT8096951.1 hypothetical protein [Woeseia sp.]
MEQNAQPRSDIDDLQDQSDAVTAHAIGWISSMRARIHVVMELAVAEATLAATSAAAMCLYVAVATLFLLGAWGLLVAGTTLALLQWGVSLYAALLGFALLHIVIAGIFAMRAVKMSRHINLAATRQQLAGDET